VVYSSCKEVADERLTERIFRTIDLPSLAISACDRNERPRELCLPETQTKSFASRREASTCLGDKR
jgi:hypothetical protein